MPRSQQLALPLGQIEMQERGLVYRGNRQRIEQAQRAVDRSVEEIDAGDFNGALASIRTARNALFGEVQR